LLMQSHSFFLGGVTMIFYGDEVGYTNDYTYLNEEGKSYDNRWMHRPNIDWEKNKRIDTKGTIEERIFSGTQHLLSLRKKLSVVADHSNITWLTPHNIHIAAYMRDYGDKRIFCVFNFCAEVAFLTWFAFKEKNPAPARLYDHWSKTYLTVGGDHEYLIMEPYSFYILEPQ